MTSDQGRDRRLAYENLEFLTGDDGRSIRILAEYLEPLQRFARANVRDTIVIFGSARLDPEGPMGRYYAQARELARRLTEWSKAQRSHAHRYVICTGGGGGLMEAANRGAADAAGQSIGLNISLPREQRPNPFVTHALSFEFHYFFMRKLWFAHLARALVVFPGGFGTLDELTEILTLAQTRKLDRPIPVILYGSAFWKEVLNLEALVKYGMIDGGDLDLFEYADEPDEAFAKLTAKLAATTDEVSPAFAHSRTPASAP